MDSLRLAKSIAAKSSQPIIKVTKKLIRVALIGMPNAGKSTLLNRLIMSDISCVSNKVHTTRRNILGVFTTADTQIELYDSPGLITKEHSLRHHLEDSLLNDPRKATQMCDLLAVVVDASNPRGSWRLNTNLLRMLTDHDDKKSFLILNKVDLVKEKRMLIDMGLRLTEGHLEGKANVKQEQLMKILGTSNARLKTGKFVIDLDRKNMVDAGDEGGRGERRLGFRNFSRVYSISALHDDGVDGLRQDLVESAKPVETWPHGPEYLSNQTSKDIVHSIIRGKVMDNVDDATPYLVDYKYHKCSYDDLGSLHVELEMICPKRYMIGQLLGEHGVVIFRIINESREQISTMLACDVKLNIVVN